jgi:DNA-binding NarL/FixJ family response regulator
MSDAARRDLHVVLADDHEVVRAGLRALVDRTPGMKVVGEAADGAEAVLRARELRPDVLVIDLTMPALDGAGATERIVRDHPEVKVLVLTAHADRAQLLRLLEVGAAGYVLKRAAADELVRAIRVVADGGTYVDTSFAAHLVTPRVRPSGAFPTAGADPLSDREKEVARAVAWGESNKEIAHWLGISIKTVETYKARIAEKLGLKSRTDIVRYALQQGWLTDDGSSPPRL